MKNFQEIFDQAEKVAYKLSWKNEKPEQEIESDFYKGENNEWKIVVARFSIEDQGFPKGSFGYDGCIVYKKMIIRMTRELSEKIFKIASVS